MLTVKRKENSTPFEKEAVDLIENLIKEVREGAEVDPLKVIRKLKSLFLENISGEFEEFLASRVNIATKRKLYGSPGKSLNLLTIVESRRRPEGYYISFKLARELPKNTELRQLLSALNIATLNVYNIWNVKRICLEEESGCVGK